MNNIAVLIPARGGSKSIPLKNIKMLGDKPLIAWTIQSALNAGIQRVIVSTDHDEIAKISREFGAEVIMRPTELAQDTTPMYDVLKSEIPKIEPIPEFVMILQPTSPFREKVHIKAAISFLTANIEEYDSLISVNRVPHRYHPAQTIVMTPTGPKMASGAPISQRITRRQDFPDAFIPDGGIYFFKTSNLERGNLYGNKVLLLETEERININEASDWEIAEQQIKGYEKI